MKHILSLLICIIMGDYATAQSVDTLLLEYDFFASDSLILEEDTTSKTLLITDLMENVIVHQDSAVYQLMINKYLGIENGLQEVNGFRVQIYSSNAQQKAKNESILLQQALEKSLSQPIYVISEPPFWKVRIGDFLTRDEADQFKNTLLGLFPELQTSTYIVPDKVLILQ